MMPSYLFTPGDNEKMISKALGGDADAVIVDFEDAVAADRKEAARDTARAVFERFVDREGRFPMPVFIRSNSTDSADFKADIELAKGCGVNGVMVPKCECARDVKVLEVLFPEAEVIPLIETALGVKNLDEIFASSPKIKKAAFGSVDFALDLGVEWTSEGLERRYAMGVLVLISRAMGKEPPIDAVFPIIDDREGFQNDLQTGRVMGFRGKMVIHPRQIGWIKEIEKVSSEEIDWLKKVVYAFEKQKGSGAFQLEGKMIDLPVYLGAKRVLERFTSGEGNS